MWQRGIGVLLCAWGMGAVVGTAHAAEAPVIVSELAWAGSSVSAADEWVELQNLSAAVVSLEGWELWSVAAEPVLLARIVQGGIAPGGYFLIANNGPQHEFSTGPSVLAVEPDAISPALALSNTALALELRRPDGSVADQVGTGGPPPVGASSPPAALVRRLEPLLPGTDPRAWALATEQRGVDLNRPDLGTPTNSGAPQFTLSACAVSWQPGEVHRELALVVTWAPGVEDASLEHGNATPLERREDGGYRLNVARPAQMGDVQLPLVARAGNGLSVVRTVTCLMTQAAREVRFSEVLTAPVEGGREFVEFTNDSNESVDLFGWELVEVRSSEPQRYSFASTIVPEGGYSQIALPSSFVLRNDGVVLELRDGSGLVIDAVRVPAARRGESWSQLVGGDWAWTQPTPSTPNGSAIERPAPNGPVGEDTVAYVALGEIAARRIAANTQVQTSGVVTQAVGVYAERTALLSDGEAAIEVVLPAGVSDVLQVVGRRAMVSGVVSSAEVPRIRVATASDVREGGQESVSVQRIDAETTFSLLKTVAFSGTVEFVDRQRWLRAGGRLFRLSVPRELDLTLSAGTELRGVGVISAVDPPAIRVLSGTVEEVREGGAVAVAQVEERSEPETSVAVLEHSASQPATEPATGQLDPQVGVATSSLLAFADLVEEQRAKLNAVEFQAATESRRGSAVTVSLLFAMLSTALLTFMGADWIWTALVTTSLTEHDSAS